ncbi:MAG: glycoside hydrolase family 88 protein [Bacteroidota bacterium]|nr:glycoside hydrolase family 88 protein [Bacteroidota bacterium]
MIFFASINVGCKTKGFDSNQYLNYCADKTSQTLGQLTSYNQMPRKIDATDSKWKLVNIEDWTSGFWPGILWYVEEFKPSAQLQAKADSFTRALTPLAFRKADNHDLGFMMFCSFGNGFRLTQNPEYKKIILQVSDSLSALFNPKVGTILSWPSKVRDEKWPHNTIIDNMMNLEMLFWASKNGGSQKLYDIAVKHAETTMQNHFRPDYTCYHVVLYDTITGKKIKGITHQGYADNSMWARGQSWAIYGFTMCYRETKKPEFLDFAQKVTDVYLKRLPSDDVPFWDFDDPAIPNAPRDASAAAITASALLELSTFVGDKVKSTQYFDAAQKMLESLSSDKYLSGDKKPSFLLHSTGHKPNNSEIDASIIYADYYYIEALLRYKKLKEGKSIYAPLVALSKS